MERSDSYLTSFLLLVEVQLRGSLHVGLMQRHVEHLDIEERLPIHLFGNVARRVAVVLDFSVYVTSDVTAPHPVAFACRGEEMLQSAAVEEADGLHMISQHIAVVADVLAGGDPLEIFYSVVCFITVLVIDRRLVFRIWDVSYCY